LPPKGKGLVADFSEFRTADQITGSVLGAGCGTGENALDFAGRGCQVVGTDFLAEPINRVRRKAGERGLAANFFVMDAVTLKGRTGQFDGVINSGLFHGFNDEARRRYVEGLAAVLKPGSRLFRGCFSDEEPGTQGPRRVSKKELHAAFGEGWSIEVRPDLKDLSFSEGGPKAWFVVVRRVG
jgi:SAM-dependent methyltransferase